VLLDGLLLRRLLVLRCEETGLVAIERAKCKYIRVYGVNILIT